LLSIWEAEGVSYDTKRKRFSTIQKVLLEAVDREQLPKVPKLPEIPDTGSAIRGYAGAVELEEVEALYRAADAATWPRLKAAQKKRLWWLTPAVWWRTWLVCWWCYGLRTQDVVGIKSKQRGLLWESVKRLPRCPVPGVKTTWPNGWLFVVPQKTKRTKGQPVIVPLLDVVAEHLAVFRDVDGVRVFPNGRSHRNFYSSFELIRQKAGVASDVTISSSKTLDGQIVRSIRKGCSQNWDDQSDGLGEWVLGHANMGTNASHYKSVAKPIVEAASGLLLPPSFTDDALLPKPQKSLLA